MIDERDKIIEELRAMIDAMKCCNNCKLRGHPVACAKIDCNDYDKWEFGNG